MSQGLVGVEEAGSGEPCKESDHQVALGNRPAACCFYSYSMAARWSWSLCQSAIWPQREGPPCSSPRERRKMKTHPDRWEQQKAWGWGSAGGGDASKSLGSRLLEGGNPFGLFSKIKESKHFREFGVDGSKMGSKSVGSGCEF